MNDLFDFFIQTICQGIIGIANLIVIDKFVVPRRDAIVRIVRRVQSTLRIPPYLWVASDTAPGITDETLLFGAWMAVLFGSGSLALFVAVVMARALKTHRGFLAGIVLPAILTIYVWFYFILERRRFDRGKRDTFDEENGDNQGSRRSIGGVSGVV
ncbi:hypothetical protein F4679DRAFT_586283 [Xylaria curta]|nr:hypothetical protein F4679DRAFT_586283 [Xylaria curta]